MGLIKFYKSFIKSDHYLWKTITTNPRLIKILHIKKFSHRFRISLMLFHKPINCCRAFIDLLEHPTFSTGDKSIFEYINLHLLNTVLYQITGHSNQKLLPFENLPILALPY